MTRPKNTSVDFWYDEAAAERAVGFFRDCLTHTKGEWMGRPLLLAPWQADEIIRPLFGWKRADGTRRYRTLFAMIPRKSGKSTLAAGIAMYLLFCDAEPAGEIFGAAADRQQAGIILDMCKAMVAASPALRARAKVYARSIFVPASGSAYKVVSSDAYSAHGFSPSAIIFDELHVQPNRELYDALTTGTGARRQPLTVCITTAGYERESLCYSMYEHARKVRDGALRDDGFLPVIYAADPDDDWTAPETWRKAHPGIGISVKESYIADECAKAKALPGYENNFKRLMLNIWTEQATRWLSVAQWDKCEFDYPALEGRECDGGLDLSTTTDLSALVLTFRDGKTAHLLPFFWCPQDGIRKRSLRDAVPYDAWVRDGIIEATPGPTIDYQVIREHINVLGARFRIRSIAYDPWNATTLVKELADDGFNMIPVRQGFISMNAPSKEFERRVLAQELNHGGNPVLRWMADNVSVRTDPAGNLKPDKETSSDRIDGIVAAIISLAAMEQAPKEAEYTAFFL
jgi:phage terminase large subunit-like protein